MLHELGAAVELVARRAAATATAVSVSGMRRVCLAVGPVPSDVARTWLANSRRIVAAVRARRPPGLDVSAAILDLIDAYLALWHDAAAGDEPFQWSVDVPAADVALIAAHWQSIAALSDDELAALGCSWAPAWTAPMYDALVAAFVDALAQDPATSDAAASLASKPPGRREP